MATNYIHLCQYQMSTVINISIKVDCFLGDNELKMSRFIDPNQPNHNHHLLCDSTH